MISCKSIVTGYGFNNYVVLDNFNEDTAEQDLYFEIIRNIPKNQVTILKNIPSMMTGREKSIVWNKILKKHTIKTTYKVEGKLNAFKINGSSLWRVYY